MRRPGFSGALAQGNSFNTLTYSLAHSFAHSLTHLLTYMLICWIIFSLSLSNLCVPFRPVKTQFESLNMDPVIPPEIPEWKSVMDMWGNKMLTAVTVLAEMLAEGFELPADAFTKRMHCGPHLLAPTGSDYSVFCKEGTILAGFHTDLNFLTIHGKSRYPGLSIWTREGVKMSVSVPDGCLLVQAGKQIEYLTGGYVLAGYHEVDSFFMFVNHEKSFTVKV